MADLAESVGSHRIRLTPYQKLLVLDVPGGPAAYLVGFSLKNQYLNTGNDPKAAGHVVKPGEATDVGDVKVTAE